MRVNELSMFQYALAISTWYTPHLLRALYRVFRSTRPMPRLGRSIDEHPTDGSQGLRRLGSGRKGPKVSVTRFAVSLMAFGPDPSNEVIILGSMLKVDVVPAFLRPGATSPNVTVSWGRCRMSSTPTVGEAGLPSTGTGHAC